MAKSGKKKFENARNAKRSRVDVTPQTQSSDARHALDYLLGTDLIRGKGITSSRGQATERALSGRRKRAANDPPPAHSSSVSAAERAAFSAKADSNSSDLLEAMGAVAEEIRERFIDPALDGSFDEFWRKKLDQVQPALKKLYEAINAAGFVPVELMIDYTKIARQCVSASERAARIIDTSAKIFMNAVSLARTSNSLPVPDDNLEAARHPVHQARFARGTAMVLIALMTIDSPQFIDSPSQGHVFRMLDEGAHMSYFSAHEAFSLRIPSDVKKFAESEKLLEHIETAFIIARESFRMIKFTHISLSADVEYCNHYITIGAEIPLSLEEATESYDSFCVAWGKAVQWPQREAVSLLHSIVP